MLPRASRGSPRSRAPGRAPGARKRWPRVVAPARSGPNSSGTTSPSNRQRMPCSGRTQRTAWSPQRIDLGQGKRARMAAKERHKHLGRRLAGAAVAGDMHPALLVVSLLERVVADPERGDEAVERRLRRPHPRSPLLDRGVGLPGRQPLHAHGQPPGRGESGDLSMPQLRLGQRPADQLAQIRGGALLHPCRDLFGEELEQQLRHALRPPPRRQGDRARAARRCSRPARGRARAPMYAARSVALITPRASRRLNRWLAFRH